MGQALIHARQVHNLMDSTDPDGVDLACLVRNHGMDIWGKFCGPKLKNKVLTSKTYISSLEFFAKFIDKGFLKQRSSSLWPSYWHCRP